MTYSDFQYANLLVNFKANEYQVSAQIKNRSRVDGDEVVQLYLSGDQGVNPLLRGFQRVHLASGEQKTVRFSVPKEDAQGRTRLSVGGGQPSQTWTKGRYLDKALP